MKYLLLIGVLVVGYFLFSKSQPNPKTENTSDFVAGLDTPRLYPAPSRLILQSEKKYN